MCNLPSENSHLPTLAPWPHRDGGGTAHLILHPNKLVSGWMKERERVGEGRVDTILKVHISKSAKIATEFKYLIYWPSM